MLRMWSRLSPLFDKDTGGDGGDTPQWAKDLLSRMDKMEANTKQEKKDPDPEPKPGKAQEIPIPNPPGSEKSGSSEEKEDKPEPKKRGFLDWLL